MDRFRRRPLQRIAVLPAAGCSPLAVVNGLPPQDGYRIEDAAAAVAWALRHAGEAGIPSHRVFVMGHSAGAYNAAMVALAPQYLAAHGADAGNFVRERVAGTAQGARRA
ncbi:MAG: alpha/beta hydrolase fold domain-containing protein [Pseudomonadota bacterium]